MTSHKERWTGNTSLLDPCLLAKGGKHHTEQKKTKIKKQREAEAVAKELVASPGHWGGLEQQAQSWPYQNLPKLRSSQQQCRTTGGTQSRALSITQACRQQKGHGQEEEMV